MDRHMFQFDYKHLDYCLRCNEHQDDEVHTLNFPHQYNEGRLNPLTGWKCRHCDKRYGHRFHQEWEDRQEAEAEEAALKRKAKAKAAELRKLELADHHYRMENDPEYARVFDTGCNLCTPWDEDHSAECKLRTSLKGV